jgi:chromosomal replication initiator protein
MQQTLQYRSERTAAIPLTERFSWVRAQEAMRLRFGDAVYNNWLSKIEVDSVSDGEIRLSAPTRFVRDWIQTHYFRKLQAVVKDVAGRHMILHLRVSLGGQAAAEVRDAADSSAPSNVAVLHAPQALAASEQQESLLSSPLDPGMTFDSFVVGDSNRMAFQAALAVSGSEDALPGGNSLFLHGAVGMGKTHLLQAVARRLRETFPGRKTAYLSAEKFMYRYVAALRGNGMMQFKEAFRNVDTLLIDDVQFICGKESTQEEFYHTVTSLLDDRKRIVVAGDRAPMKLDGLHERLKSRFGGGLAIGMEGPDHALRLAILERKCARYKNMRMDEGVPALLAERISGSVRDLDGALNRIVAHATLMDAPVTLDAVQRLLHDMLSSGPKTVSTGDVQKKVADYFSVSLADMLSNNRSRSVVLPRQIAMYLCKKMTTRSLSEISRRFNKKDHTTVLHAVKRIEQLTAEDSDVRTDVERLELALRQ